MYDKVCVLIFLYIFTADFIHLCKKNDPKIDQCLLETVESLRPKFETGNR